MGKLAAVITTGCTLHWFGQGRPDGSEELFCDALS